MLELTQANIFFAIFAFGALFTLLAFVVGELFDGLEDLLGSLFDFFDFADVDGGHPGIFRALMVCIAGFGASGWTATVYGMSALPSSAIGALAGLVCGALTMAVLVFVTKQQASSTIAPASIEGSTGTLTLAIPERGTGQAVLSVAGARVTKPARSAGGSAIATNARVKVIALEGDSVVVETVTGSSE